MVKPASLWIRPPWGTLLLSLLATFAGVFHLLAAPPPESVIVDGHAAHPTRILARRKPSTTAAAALNSVQAMGRNAVISHSFGLVPGLVIIDSGLLNVTRAGVPNREARAKELAERIAALRATGLYEYVEPDRYLEPQSTPAEPTLSSGDLWGLRNVTGLRGVDVDADAAWQLTAGTSNVVVAVIDTGIDIGHADLMANLWVNRGEIPGNQRDDDGNGYIDDIHGIDLVDSPTGTPLSKDENGHGTHVAGTIAAASNDFGVVGLAHGVRLLGIRIFDATGRGGAVSAVIAGLDYAARQGARVVNASFGGPFYSQAAFDAYSAAGSAGVLVVCAAGNETRNNDLAPGYPASYRLPNLLSVASVNQAGELSRFSNYGLDSVDVAAPGERIYSTYTNNSYTFLDGTSMATPHVSAVAALVLSRHSGLAVEELRQRLLQSTVPLPSLAGKVRTGGIVNAFRALALNPDGNPEFELRPGRGHFVAGRSSVVEVAVSDVNPLAAGELEMTLAASPTVSLRDDGISPDRLPADGIYTGMVTPQASGDQQAQMTLRRRGQTWQRQLATLVNSPVANDFFSSRPTLTVGTAGITGSTFGAGIETLEPELQGRRDAATVWYRFTPEANSTYILDAVGQNFEPTLRVYSGGPLATLKPWTNGLQSYRERAFSRLAFSTQAGVPLAISLSADMGEQGEFKLQIVDANTPPRPPNDNRQNATHLSTTRSFRTDAESRFATIEPGEPLHDDVQGGKSVWWRYTPAASGVLEVSTFGSDFDTVLAAYQNGSSVALAANDDARGSDGITRRSSYIAVSVTKGTPIDIAVDGWNGESGNVVLQGRLTPGFNDLYDHPHLLVSGKTTTGSNVGATKGLGEPNHANDRGGASVWYEWRATVGGTTTVTVTPRNAASLSPRVAVYVGPQDLLVQSDWNEVKLVNSSPAGTTTFQAMAGQSYRIAVDGKYYQRCFLVLCSDEVEQGDFDIVLNQQAELSQLIYTGYELNNDAELISLAGGSSAAALTGYWNSPALSFQYSRWFSATGAAVFHGYTNLTDLAGGRLRLSCSLSHSGGGGNDAVWGLGFLVYPVGYSAEAGDLLSNAKLLFFAFDSAGTDSGLLVGTPGSESTTVSVPGLRVAPGQRHSLNLELNWAAQSFEVKLDGAPSAQLPLSLFGRVNLAQGPFVFSAPAAPPYPTFLLDDLDVRILPRDLGSPPPPLLGVPRFAAGTGRITLPIDAPPDSTWILESSADLILWEEVTRGTSQGAAGEIDAGPPPLFGPLFWRVRTP